LLLGAIVMFLFKNFIVVVILVGIITRASFYFFSKKLASKKQAVYIGSLVSGLITCLIAAPFVGFDIVVAEYVSSFVLWFVFDLLRLESVK
jgi:hypothetical protein